MNEGIAIESKMLTGAELDEGLRILPEYDIGIRKKSASERLCALQNLYRIYIPTVMSQEIYTKLYLALLRSLQKKNTIRSVMQYNQNHKRIKQNSYESIIGGSDSFTIIGPSGIGKSASISRAISVISDSVIIKEDDAKIIPCLQIQAPGDSSVKGMLVEILRKIDEILQTNYYKNALRSHATVDVLIGVVSSVALNHLGVLIIDEMQNIVAHKSGTTVLATITQLINNSGISICFVGTPESTVFFEQNLIMARRSLGLRYDMMQYDETFKRICYIILGYCYTAKAQDFDEGLLMWLYNHSGGNISVVISLIHDAQEAAIIDGYDRLDTVSLTKAYEKRLSMLHSYITVPQVIIKKQKKTTNCPDNLNKENRVNIIENISIFEILAVSKENNTDPIKALLSKHIQISEVTI